MKDATRGQVHRAPAGEAITALILATFRLNGRLLTAGDQLTCDLGLSSARYQVMYAVLGGPLPVAQIARQMGLTRQSVQRTVDLLAAEQLVTFADNPYHQRAKLVRLTDRGHELLQEVLRRQASWANRLGQGLPPDGLQATARLMETIRQRLEEPQKGTGARHSRRQGDSDGVGASAVWHEEGSEA